MKKLILVILPLLIWGCQKKYDNLVDPPAYDFQANSVYSLNSYRYSIPDSSITLSLSFSSVDGIQNVYCNILDPDNNQLNYDPVYMNDDGKLAVDGDSTAKDKVYSAKFPMGHYYANGTYQVNYYVTDKNDNVSLAAIKTFTYDNGQSNVPPVISNLSMADSVGFEQAFTFSVKATDGNGYSDIAEVYYELYRPDGTQVVNQQGLSQFPMYDNGDVSGTGDVTAGDGIFTFMLAIPTGQQSGTWKFVFQAKDRTGALSNTITHNIIVK
jgi:hypothetical protein